MVFKRCLNAYCRIILLTGLLKTYVRVTLLTGFVYLQPTFVALCYEGCLKIYVREIVLNI